MVPNATLETVSFNPFIVNENMNDCNQDADLNFFDKSLFSSLDTDYVSLKDFRVSLHIIPKTLSLFHIRILEDLVKTLESFKEVYNLQGFSFSIVCFSETWSKNEKVNENSLYQLEGYNLLHQNRKQENGGGVPIFVKN